MEKRFEQLETNLDIVNKKLDRVIFYLESDVTTKRKGVIEELAETKDALTKLLAREQVYKTQAAMIGGAVAFIVMGIGKVITFFIK